jgi:hypothetical protein
MIQHVEEFRPELNVKALGKALNVIVLDQGKIEVRKAVRGRRAEQQLLLGSKNQALKEGSGQGRKSGA